MEVGHPKPSQYSKTIARARRVAAAFGVASGIAFATAVPSSAAIDGMTNNWSNWWDANAQVWVYNPSMAFQSVAAIGNDVRYGAVSNSYSAATARGFSWTHYAYQNRLR